MTGSGSVDLRQPDQLLAAIPHLLGFRPTESVLVIGHRGQHGDQIGNMLRADLPARNQVEKLVSRIGTPLSRDDSVGATVVVVAPTAEDSDELPHRELVAALTAGLAEDKLRVMHVLWVPEIRVSAPWRCYQESTCFGSLPDPDSTVMAAVATHAGLVTYSSREAMEQQLSPVDSEILERRAGVLQDMVAERGTPVDPVGSERSWEVQRECTVVRNALDRMAREEFVVTDDTVVELALALRHPRVRDACLATALPPGSPHATTAERLWLTMVSHTPAPERAQVATLLAYSAYVRGEGALAGMAVASALEADPRHVLAGLLAQSLDHALPPRTLARLGSTCDSAPLWRADVSPRRNAASRDPG